MGICTLILKTSHFIIIIIIINNAEVLCRNLKFNFEFGHFILQFQHDILNLRRTFCGFLNSKISTLCLKICICRHKELRIPTDYGSTNIDHLAVWWILLSAVPSPITADTGLIVIRNSNLLVQTTKPSWGWFLISLQFLQFNRAGLGPYTGLWNVLLLALQMRGRGGGTNTWLFGLLTPISGWRRGVQIKWVA